MASGNSQERPAGERVRLRRHTDRFVARAHGRPLRQNVSTYYYTRAFALMLNTDRQMRHNDF